MQSQLHMQRLGKGNNGSEKWSSLTERHFHRPSANRKLKGRVQAGKQSKPAEPDFDSLVLDDDYYKEIGLTREQALEELDDVLNTDPMNDPDLNDDDCDDEDDSDYEPESIPGGPDGNKRGQTIEATISEPPPYGPAAVILAGFREHELGMVRAMFDEAGAYDLKVIPCQRGMIYGTVQEAIYSQEPDWGKPKSVKEDLGGANYGSVRTILFSGLNQNDMLAALTLMEYAGLPQVLVCTASPENSNTVLGQILAETLQEQRRKPKLSKDFDFTDTFTEMFEESLGFNSKSSKATNSSASSNTEGWGTEDEQQKTADDQKFKPGFKSVQNSAERAFEKKVRDSKISKTQQAPSGQIIEDDDILDILEDDIDLQPKKSNERKASSMTEQQAEVSKEILSNTTPKSAEKIMTAVQGSLEPSTKFTVSSKSSDVPKDIKGGNTPKVSGKKPQLPQNQSKPFRGMSLAERLAAQRKATQTGKNAAGVSKLGTNSFKPSSPSSPKSFAFSKNRSPVSNVKPVTKPSITPSQKATNSSNLNRAQPSVNSQSQNDHSVSQAKSPYIGRWATQDARKTDKASTAENPSSLTNDNEHPDPSKNKENLSAREAPLDLPPESPIGFSPNLRGWAQSKNQTTIPKTGETREKTNMQWPQKGSRPARDRLGNQQDDLRNSRPRGFQEAEFTDSTPEQKPQNAKTTPASSRQVDARADRFEGASLNSDKGTNAQNSERPALWHEEQDSAKMMQEIESAVPGTASIFGGSIQTHESAEEERRLRREAAEEMQKRAKLAQNSGNQEAFQEALNMIDAVAAGEDLDTMINLGAQKKESIKDVVEAQSAENKKKMEAVLNQLRAGAAALPEEERKKLNQQVKILEDDKESISKVLAQLGAGLDSVPKDDRNELQSQLKKEAWDPTKDAIGAALACGISAEELREMVAKAEADKKVNKGGWYPSVAQATQKDLEQFKRNNMN